MNKIALFALAALLPALVALMLTSCPVYAQELTFTKTEIRDPMMNNAVAAQVALPKGWVIKKREVAWNFNLYSNPAHVIYELQGPTDEVEFSAISKIQFGFNQSWLTLMDYMYNEMSSQSDQQCQMAQTYTPAAAGQICGQANASLQEARQKIEQQKKAILSGKAVENGAIAMPPMWAADVAQWILRENKELTDVRITKIERPADLANLLQTAVSEQQSQVRQLAAQYGLPFKSLSFDVARIYFGYIKDGKKYDGVSLLVTRYCTFLINQKLPSISPQTGPDPLYGKEIVLWDVHINNAAALAGTLQKHETELTAIAANSAVDPVWQAAVDKISADISQKIAKGQAEMWQREMAHQENMQQMRNETFNEVNQRRQEVLASRSQAHSNVATGWTDVLSERQRWKGSGDTYSAPDDYHYAWEGQDGKTVYSNDSNFNPNSSLDYSGDWTQMEKIPW